MDGNLISRAEALRILEPHLPLLEDSLAAGWSAWQSILRTDVGAALSRSARARVVYDHATARAEHLFAFVAGVNTYRLHGLTVIDFGRVLVRFKKLDADLRSRGIPTGQQQMFASQEHVLADPEQLCLFPPAPMLIAGYVLDRLGTAIERMVIVLSVGDTVLWELPLRDETAMFLPVGLSEFDTAVVVRSARKPEVEREAQ